MTKSEDHLRRTRRFAPARIWSRAPGSLVTLIVLCAIVELVLLLSDFGLVGGGRLRAFAYENGGFWRGLLGDWKPNYAAQPYLMFLTYAFLHAGLAHLLVNMATLYSFGRMIVLRVGQRRFLALYVVSALGGALGFAALSSASAPMVGASGALFGLVGAWMAWDYVDRYAAAARLWPVARGILALLFLNALLWWAMDGRLAWETHLGGFVAGWIVALVIDPTSRPRRRIVER